MTLTEDHDETILRMLLTQLSVWNEPRFSENIFNNDAWILLGHFHFVDTKSLNFSRTSLSVLSGVASGILGLTSVYGFLFYLITSGLLGFYYLLSDTRSQTKCFLNKQQLVTAFVMENLFTYILVWTLIYGCVHVYWGVHLLNVCYYTFAFELIIFSPQ